MKPIGQRGIRWILLSSTVLAGVLLIGAAALTATQLIQNLFEVTSGRTSIKVPSEASGAISQGSLDSARVTAHVDSVILDIFRMPAEAIGLFVFADVVALISLLLPAAGALWLCVRVIVGKPFSALTTRIIVAAGLVATLGSIAVALIQGAAQSAAINSVLPAQLFVPMAVSQQAIFYAVFNLQYQLLPIVIGLTSLLLAAVFHQGTGMAKDIKGLV